MTYEMSKLTIKIEGMSCGHCKMALEAAIGQMDGVSSVQVDLENNLANIEVENENIKEKVLETIKEAGYTPA